MLEKNKPPGENLNGGFTVIELIGILLLELLLEETRTGQKLCHVAKAKLFCLKSFVPVPELQCTYGKIFIPVRYSPASKFLQRKEWRGEISGTEPKLTGLI